MILLATSILILMMDQIAVSSKVKISQLNKTRDIGFVIVSENMILFFADANASAMGQVIQYEEFYESYLKIDGNKAETYSSKNEVSIKRNQVADESHHETFKTTTCEDHQDHRKKSSKVVMVSVRRTSIDSKSTASEFCKKKKDQSLYKFESF